MTVQAQPLDAPGVRARPASTSPGLVPPSMPGSTLPASEPITVPASGITGGGVATQLPLSQVSPAGQRTPSHASTQPVAPHTCPAGQPAPHALARQTPSALQVSPIGQPESSQRVTHSPASQT